MNADESAADRSAARRDAVLARVVEILPNAQFLVAVEAEQDTVGTVGREVTVHFAGAMRVRGVRLVTGDRVSIEMSPFDPTKGRIVGLGPRRADNH